MNPDVQPDDRDEDQRPDPADPQIGPGEKLAKRIRAALGPYNDEDRSVQELVGVLVNHVHRANQYRAMVINGGQAAQGALDSGDPQRAFDILMAVTRPPAPPKPQPQPQPNPEAGDG